MKKHEYPSRTTEKRISFEIFYEWFCERTEKSDENIKIYVKTMYAMEENKKIKKILEDILK